jgi:hydrogenase nickel incorporation protein HypA/HybF
VHETQIAREVLEVGLREAEQRGAKLMAVRIEIDATSHESPEALELAFEATAAGTPAEGARLEIVRTPVTVQCPHCDHEFDGESEMPTCPECHKEFIWPHHSHDVRVVAVTLDE